ncbi:zinc ribbon domain-containing protein [Halobacteriales archaeon QS_1_68_17]|nr:MAG: zinc ribbon domain-containing protein [Halobacteriales archaeon QS_1_68_17]
MGLPAQVAGVELAFRVLLTAVMIVLPTLLFLGLWRGLTYLRDDDLAEQVVEGRVSSPTGADSYVSVSAADFVPGGDGEAGDVDTVACPTCGTPNLRGMTFCRECLDKLPEE